MATNDIDLLAGTKRSNMANALLLQALSGKPAYGGAGEAAARALSAGLMGMIDKRDAEDERARGAKEAGEMARAIIEFGKVGNSLPGSTSQSPTPSLPSPRLPQVGSPQDTQVLPENPNDRIAAIFGGMNPQQRDVATRTVLGEAANQGPLGMQAVADVMKNRADAGGYRTGTGPTTMDRVATAPGQFEPHMTAAGRARMNAYSPNSPAYQTAQAAVDNASIGGQPDVTGGATFFYSPSVNAQLAAQDGRKAVPDWAAGRQPNTTIGTHQFFAPEGKPSAQAFAQGPQASMTDAATDRIIQTIEDPKTSPRMRMFMLQQLQTMQTKLRDRKPEFKTIKDADGKETAVWVDPYNQSVTPAQTPGSGAPSAPPTVTLPDGRQITMPAGMDPKKWKEHVTNAVADAQAGKQTETQANATTFANRMEAAETNVKQFEGAATGIKDNMLRGVTDAPYSPVPRGATNWAVSKEYKQYEQAKSQFITAMLRRESGAAIAIEEFNRYDREFFPQVGDDAEVIKQKRDMRNVAIEGMKKGAGPVYSGPKLPEAAPFTPQQGGGPIRVASPDEARKLPKGTKIILPDGSPGVVP